MLSQACRVLCNPLRNPEAMNRFQSLGSTLKLQLTSPANLTRNFKTDATLRSDKHFIRRAKERMGIKERAMQPTSGAPFSIGQGVLLGASAFGLGSLCYYGLGLSNEPGTLERSLMWPQYVRDRIHATYSYFGGSIILTAASAAAAFRSPVMMNLMMKNSWLVIGGSLVAMIGTQMLCTSIPYTPGFGTKQLAWMAHSGVMGVVLAPFCMLGGPIMLRAAVMTAGIIGGLSTLAVCAPSEKFLNMGGPLAIGLGVVFASSLGSMFLPPSTALGASLFSISLYGGLVLFSAFLLYDTQRIMKTAELTPINGEYDPINASIGIYLDTINIFIRIAQILAMGGGRKK